MQQEQLKIIQNNGIKDCKMWKCLVKQNVFEKGVTLHWKSNFATFCGSFGFVSDALIISAAQKKISAFCIWELFAKISFDKHFVLFAVFQVSCIL